MQMFDWLKINNIAFVAVLNKCDYISRNEVFNKTKEIERILKIPVFPFSSKVSAYKEQIMKFFEENIS